MFVVPVSYIFLQVSDSVKECKVHLDSGLSYELRFVPKFQCLVFLK